MCFYIFSRKKQQGKIRKNKNKQFFSFKDINGKTTEKITLKANCWKEQQKYKLGSKGSKKSLW